MIKLTVGVELIERNGRDEAIIPRIIETVSPITPNSNSDNESNRQWPTGWMFNPVYLFNRKVW